MLAVGPTYSAHPVSCAAALEVLKIYEDDKLNGKCSMQWESILITQVEKLKQKHPSIGDWQKYRFAWVVLNW